MYKRAHFDTFRLLQNLNLTFWLKFCFYTTPLKSFSCLIAKNVFMTYNRLVFVFFTNLLKRLKKWQVTSNPLYFFVVYMTFIGKISSFFGLSPESFDENVMYSTLQIFAVKSSGTETGTGFVFGIPVDSSRYYSFLMTNKHVLAEANQIGIKVHRGSNGKPLQESVGITIDPAAPIFYHPDTGVDLCAIFLGPTLNANGEFFVRPICPNDLFDETTSSAKLNAGSDITMVGYP